MRREIEGFILNRLQGALLAEAFRLVGEGYVSPQDLDKTIKDGLGLRWSFMGPFATIELNAPGGIADYCARYTGFYKRLQSKPAGPEVYDDANIATILKEWGKQATPEQLAELTRWRDQRLAALAAHKNEVSMRASKDGRAGVHETGCAARMTELWRILAASTSPAVPADRAASRPVRFRRSPCRAARRTAAAP